MWPAPYFFRNSCNRTCPTLPPLASAAFALAAACSGATEPDRSLSFALEEHATLPSPSPEPAANDKCWSVQLTSTRVQPTLWLVIDGSGSMSESLSQLDSTPRWDALRGALLDTDRGVIGRLQEDVKWGMVMYDGPLPTGDATPPTACPRLVTVQPQLENANAIAAAYPSVPLGGSTPTHKALESVLARVSDPITVNDPNAGPNIVVLATDGQPNDFCTTAAPAGEVRAEVVDLVRQLAAKNADVYVVSLAGDDAELTQHLEEVAAVGGTDRGPFVPRDRAELAQSLRDIMGPAPSCEIALPQPVKPGRDCEGRVRLNGVTLQCNVEDGFHLKTRDMLELTGDACRTFVREKSVQLEVEFPCDIF